VTFHQIVEGGEDSDQLHRFGTRVMDMALLPFAVAFGVNVSIVARKLSNIRLGILAGAACFAIAILFWYGIALADKARHRDTFGNLEMFSRTEDDSAAAEILDGKIKHVLTEVRVVIPGAQALLGFQFITMLTDSFDRLPASSKYIHLASLCCITTSVVLLMTPAAYHRIVEQGNNSNHFHRFASAMLLAAMIPLAVGMAGDFFVVARKLLGSPHLALAGGLLVLIGEIGVWFALPLIYKKCIRTDDRSAA
jgi:hypothetical protein